MTPFLCVFYHHYEVSTVAGRPFLYCTHCGDTLPLNPYRKEDKPKKKEEEE